MLFSPLAHGAVGFWDELTLILAPIVAVVTFIVLALRERKHGKKDNPIHEDDDR
jgi:hypothetical protein